MTQSNTTSICLRCKAVLRAWLFPLGVAGLYGVGFVFAPESTEKAGRVSVLMFRQLGLSICLVLVMMVVLNRFLSPAMVTRFLGQGSGLKSVLLSSLAGVLSLGPVYAWHPLLKSIRDKGASEFHIANFICCRSVKPVLLPVLAVYFGWRFVVCFVLVSLAGALIVAFIVNLSSHDSHKQKNDSEE